MHSCSLKRLRKAEEPQSALLMKYQQRNFYFCKSFFFSSSKSSWWQPLSEAEAPQGPGRELPMAPCCPQQQRSLFSPCLALALLSHIAKTEAENLVLQLPLEHLLLVGAQDSTEATQFCMLTSPFKAARRLISFGLHCVHQNNKQVDHHGICFAHFVTQLPHTLLRSTRLNKEFAWEKKKGESC